MCTLMYAYVYVGAEYPPRCSEPAAGDAECQERGGSCTDMELTHIAAAARVVCLSRSHLLQQNCESLKL